ncbi:hypothetical protein OROHE_021916 [Orobanche hederae]
MDGTPDYSTTWPSVSKDRGKVDYPVVSALGFDSHGVPFSLVINGNKRKCSTLDRPINANGGSSLVLGLGLSSNSCTTMCSGKELDDESSIDLSLSINLNVRDKNSSNLKKVSKRRPVLDLELSLSTGTIESDATSVAEALISYPNHPESPDLAPTLQLVDEGSTSSRWKMGPLVPPLNTQVDIPALFDQNLDDPNLVVPIIPSTAFSTPSSVETASHTTNKQQQQHKTRVKMCRFEGCTRGARGASALCIAHGGGRRCQKAGCQKGAEGKTIFCKAHGGGRRCQHLGCTKCAEGRTDYCIGHGGGRRCGHEGCSRAARGKSGLCIRHGGGKRCKVESCTKSAEGISGLCISHGGGRRCQYTDCTKGAQGSTSFCKAHGGGRRCMFLGCMRGAEGSTLFCKGHGGGKRCTSEGCTKSVHGGTLFCVSHGGGKRCSVSDCTKSARGRTSYCVRHGGGKRCRVGGCSKSAQGSTDYCKAHGGGKRCSWEWSGEAGCDKFVRGKSGLCAAHSAQVQEKGIPGHTSTQMNGVFAAGNDVSCPVIGNNYGTASNVSTGYEHQSITLPLTTKEGSVVGNPCWENLSLPEGRVHGGSLMAMLRGVTAFGTSNNSNTQGSTG